VRRFGDRQGSRAVDQPPAQLPAFDTARDSARARGSDPQRAESVQVAGECFGHLDTLGQDERKGDGAAVTALPA
jgi:hypothetical protein